MNNTFLKCTKINCLGKICLLIIENIHCGQQLNYTTEKPIVHPKINIRFSFTHPLVISNLYDFLSTKSEKRNFEMSGCVF